MAERQFRHLTSGTKVTGVGHGRPPGSQRLPPIYSAVLELQGRAGNAAVAAAFGGSEELFIIHGLLQKQHPELAPFLLHVVHLGEVAEGDPAGREVLEVLDTAKDKVDSLSEMEQLDDLYLQSTMQKFSLFMSMLSNVLKKASETTSDITQNFK